METLFISTRSKSQIFFGISRGAILWTGIFLFLYGATDNFSNNFLGYIFVSVLFFGIPLLLKTMVISRYYITQIQVTDDALIIDYLYFFRPKKIKLKKANLYFRLNDFRRELKCLEFVSNDKRIIKQVPFQEWEMPAMHQVKSKLEDNGVRYRTFW